MKKISMILGAALFCLTGCDKTVTTMAPQHLKLDLTIHNQMAPATKAVKTGWADGDKVYVFFGKPADRPTPAYLTLTRSGSSWTEAWTEGLEAEIAATTSGTLTAFFSPMDFNTIEYLGPLQMYNIRGDHYCFALSCDNVPYTVSDGVLSATMEMGLSEPSFVQFFLPGEASNAANLTFSSNYIIKCAGAMAINKEGKVSQGIIAASNPIPGFAFDGGVIFSGMLDVSVSGKETGYTFTIVDNKGTDDTSDDVTYTLNKTTTLSIKDAILLPALSEWPIQVPVPDLVDLGLSVKWATFNLGASKPEEYGNYYAWGEITPKSTYIWDNYFDTTDGGSTFTKYAKDKKTVLEPSEDAAYAALGGRFRMPTRAEIEALLGLPNEWVTNYNGSGINGYKFTGNGNTLFLPAAGYYGIGSEQAGNYGRYWSTTLNLSNSPMAVFGYFNSLGTGSSSTARRYGYSVRPVSD